MVFRSQPAGQIYLGGPSVGWLNYTVDESTKRIRRRLKYREYIHLNLTTMKYFCLNHGDQRVLFNLKSS